MQNSDKNEIMGGIAEIKNGIAEILQAIGHYSNTVENRFQTIESKLTNVEGKLETDMATKEYMDERVSEIKGELIGIIRKEDKKLVSAVEKLEHKSVFSMEDSQEIAAMEPFPAS